MIGNDVLVTVGNKGNQVSIGVAAPKEVPVYREDLPAHSARPAKYGNTTVRLTPFSFCMLHFRSNLLKP